MSLSLTRTPPSVWRAVAIAVCLVWSTALVPGPCAGQVLELAPGIRAGGTMSRLPLSSTPPGVDTNFNSGFLVGATLGLNGLPVVGLEIQALYVEQGGEFAGSIDSFGDKFEGKARVKVAYLAIPLYANFKAPGVTVRPYAKLGPQLGLRITANAELEPLDGVTVENDIKDDTNTTDFSLYFAGGLEFPLTKVNAYFEVGYSVGFTDLFKQDQNLGGDLINAKNHVLAITAGLSY